MTPLEYMQNQVRKQKYNLGQQTVRGAREEELENIRKNISYYEAAVEALTASSNQRKGNTE